MCCQHNEDQHNGVEEHPIVGELTKRFRQNRQDGSGDNASDDVSHAAEYDENEDQDVDVL